MPIGEDLTYAQRKGKKYKKKFVNAHQTNRERREKYRKVRQLGYPAFIANKLRDYRHTKLDQFITLHKVNEYVERV